MSLQVVPVQKKGDRLLFIEFPYALHAQEPNWVPPLVMERKDFLNPKKNPWFEFGKAQLFLARREGKVVGRIAAVEDPHYNQFHGTNIGWFGMFECIDDVAVARALFDAAQAWVKQHGHTELLGPANFSSSYEFGALQEGFDTPPAVLMPFNPRYYLRLYEDCGFVKAKDLWAWSWFASGTASSCGPST